MTLTSRDNYYYLAALVIILITLGQIILFSASSVLGLQRHQSEFYYLFRQGPLAFGGLGLLFFVSKIRYQFWMKMAVPLMFFQLLLLAATLYSSHATVIQGTRRWLNVGPIHFQPSEFAKITVAVYGAWLFSLATQKQKPWPAILVRSIPLFLLMGFIFKQPDLGTTVLLGVVLFSMLIVAGIELKYLLGSVGVGLMLTAIALITSPYRKRRMLAFLNPWEDPQGKGFQTIQSFLSLHSGSWFGVGLGNGNSKLFYLPEVHTDFIFTVVGEEFGFIGALAFLGVFLFFCYLLFAAVLKAPSEFAKFLSLALAVALTFQICVNLGGVTGLLPVKGLPLPFISWGRSALLVNLTMVGILLNVLRQSEMMANK